MGSLLRFVFWVGVLFAIVAGLGRLVAIRWWQIPDDDPVLEASITPTLHGGDWVLLWRATSPKFGALVVCPDPRDESQVVIARIVGEEGDTLTVDGARILLNDHEALTETACGEPTFRVNDPNTGTEVEQSCSTEALGGVLHKRGELIGAQQIVLKTNRTVGDGKTYLISDNRNYPYDSRTYGSVDRSTCKESIFFRLVGKNGFSDEKSRLAYIR